MKISIDKNEVVVRIPLPEDVHKCPLSASGNNYVVGSSLGWLRIPNTDMRLSLNLVSPARGRREVKAAQAERITPVVPVVDGPALRKKTGEIKPAVSPETPKAVPERAAPLPRQKSQEPLRVSLLDLLNKGGA